MLPISRSHSREVAALCPGPGLCSEGAFGEQKPQNLRRAGGQDVDREATSGTRAGGSQDPTEQLRDLNHRGPPLPLAGRLLGALCGF